MKDFLLHQFNIVLERNSVTDKTTQTVDTTPFMGFYQAIDTCLFLTGLKLGFENSTSTKSSHEDKKRCIKVPKDSLSKGLATSLATVHNQKYLAYLKDQLNAVKFR